MMKKRLLMVTWQAGTVAAFEPLIKLLKSNDWHFDIIAFDQSKIEWSNLGYKFSDRRFLHENEILRYNVVLTGTPSKVDEVSLFWKLAKKKGIPSVAFVDSWVNYSERFTEQNVFDRTPDFIGLADDLMHRRMVENGAPVEKLVIVGHPRFDTILQKYPAYCKKRSDKNSIYIIFFTDPVAGDKTGNVGYDSQTVVKFVLDQFSKQSQRSNTKIFFTVKPHPRESPADYKEIIDGINVEGWAAISNEDPLKLMGKADVVMGMNTILLMDSSLLGIPTYSFQPGRNATRNDITDRRNIHVITTWEDAEKEVMNILFKKPRKEKTAFKENHNAKRFVNFIHSISNDSHS